MDSLSICRRLRAFLPSRQWRVSKRNHATTRSICNDPRHTFETKLRIIEKYAKSAGDRRESMREAVRRTHLTVADVALIDLDYWESLRWNRWITPDVFAAIRQRCESEGGPPVRQLFGQTVFANTGMVCFMGSYHSEGMFAFPHVADLESTLGSFLLRGYPVIHVVANQSYTTFSELMKYIDKHCGDGAHARYEKELERNYHRFNPYVDPVERIFYLRDRGDTHYAAYENACWKLTQREHDRVSNKMLFEVPPLVATPEWWDRNPHIEKRLGVTRAHISRYIVDYSGYLYARKWPAIDDDKRVKTPEYARECKRVYTHYVKLYADEIANALYRKIGEPGGLLYHENMMEIAAQG